MYQTYQCIVHFQVLYLYSGSDTENFTFLFLSTSTMRFLHKYVVDKCPTKNVVRECDVKLF